MGTETSAHDLNLHAFSHLLRYCRYANVCLQYLHSLCICSLTDCLTDYQNKGYDESVCYVNKAEEVIDTEIQPKSIQAPQPYVLDALSHLSCLLIADQVHNKGVALMPAGQLLHP